MQSIPRGRGRKTFILLLGVGVIAVATVLTWHVWFQEEDKGLKVPGPIIGASKGELPIKPKTTLDESTNTPYVGGSWIPSWSEHFNRFVKGLPSIEQLKKLAPSVTSPKEPLEAAIEGETLQRVRSATVYVRVNWLDGRAATGSGFFAVTPGLVLTNAHVVDMLQPDRKGPDGIELVLNSGQPNERRVQATLLTVDWKSDLAVLKVPSEEKGLPAPLVVRQVSGMVETRKVLRASDWSDGHRRLHQHLQLFLHH